MIILNTKYSMLYSRGFTPTPTLASLQSFFKRVLLKIMFHSRGGHKVEPNHAVKTMPMLVSGFTLIELLVTIGIFTVISGVVLSNYRSFITNAVFTNDVEGTYLALREAQVYGTGGRRDSGAGCGTPTPSLFNCAYGVHFTTATPGSYIFFVDRDEDHIFDTGELIQLVPFGTGTTITSLVCPGGCINVNVTFKRPNPDAFIAVTSGQAVSLNGVDITISKDSKNATLKISPAGQISIQ